MVLEASNDERWMFRIGGVSAIAGADRSAVDWLGHWRDWDWLRESPVKAYLRWLGWTVTVAAVGGAVSGLIQAYMGEPTAITQTLGIAAPTVITLWLLVMGVLLIRKGRGPQPESTTRGVLAGD